MRRPRCWPSSASLVARNMSARAKPRRQLLARGKFLRGQIPGKAVEGTGGGQKPVPFVFGLSASDQRTCRATPQIFCFRSAKGGAALAKMNGEAAT